MKRIAWMALAVVCVCGWASARGLAKAQKGGGSPAVAFHVTPIRSTYTEGEAVELQLQMTNNSRTTLIVDGNFALGSTIFPNLTDPQGKAIDWEKSFAPRNPYFVTVSPGGTLTRIVCLNCAIRDPFQDPLEQTGEYTARFEYKASSVAAQAVNFPGASPLDETVTTPAFHFQISPAAVVFTAQPTEPTFQVGDPVTFRFQLKNNSKQSLLAAYDLSLNDSVYLRVLDANGNAVSWNGKPRSATSMLSTVSAGSTISSAYPITPTNLFGTMVAGCNITKPGTYTAYAVYRIPESFNVLRAYVGILPILLVPGPIQAPPVKFTVEAAAAPSSSTNSN